MSYAKMFEISAGTEVADDEIFLFLKTLNLHDLLSMAKTSKQYNNAINKSRNGDLLLWKPLLEKYFPGPDQLPRPPGITYKKAFELRYNQILAAVRKNCYAFQHASIELRNTPEIVLAAVTQYGGVHGNYALRHASIELRNTTEIVLAAVRRNGYALMYASDKLRNNHEIVLAAVTQDGYALMYASDELRNNHEIVLAAVTQCGYALRYASRELRNNRQLEAIASIMDDRKRGLSVDNYMSGFSRSVRALRTYCTSLFQSQCTRSGHEAQSQQPPRQ